jgi:hypothetical protein
MAEGRNALDVALENILGSAVRHELWQEGEDESQVLKGISYLEDLVQENPDMVKEWQIETIDSFFHTQGIGVIGPGHVPTSLAAIRARLEKIIKSRPEPPEKGKEEGPSQNEKLIKAFTKTKPKKI